MIQPLFRGLFLSSLSPQDISEEREPPLGLKISLEFSPKMWGNSPMKPRLTTSRKWTSLPKEYLQQIKEVFTEKFQESLQGGEIITEGRIYPKELLLRIGYIEPCSLKQINFEISIEYDKNKQNMIQLIYTAIDCIGSMMNEHFSSKETDFLLSWQPFDFEGQKIFLQHSTINTKLETRANELLSKTHSHDLVQGNNEAEELALIKAQLGLEDETP